MEASISGSSLVMAAASALFLLPAALDLIIGKTVGAGMFHKMYNSIRALMGRENAYESGGLDLFAAPQIFRCEQPMLYWSILFGKFLVGGLLLCPLILEISRAVKRIL